MAEHYFITAIHTDSGKTLVSTIFAQALHADYWKPIQAGYPRDTDTVSQFLQNKKSQTHKEAYLLQAPMSPHAAARLEHLEIHPENILMPETTNTLIIEGAGGILAPISDDYFVIDIAKKFDLQVILVCNIYLGSINHSMLTINELKRRKLNVRGIVFNGPENTETEQFILRQSGYPCLLRIKQEKKITQEIINRYAIELLANLNRLGEQKG
jgi:dethiobiotin synthetase